MRVVTRGDFDSLISSVLLSLVHEVEDYIFKKPKDILEDECKITSDDIIANLPYHKNCGMWFDHHINEDRKAHEIKFKGCFKIAPSCARVIFDCYNSVEEIKRFEKIVQIADKVDSADFAVEDIVNPHGWFLLERTIHAYDPQGSLGNFRDYFKMLVHLIKHYSLSEILLSDEVQARIAYVRGEHKIFVNALHECTSVDKNVIVTDSRKIRYFPNGNRFLIYTLYPAQNVSVSIFNKRGSDYSVIFCGHNIFNKTCKTDINELLKKYNGSGRKTAGTCMVPKAQSDEVLQNIISDLKKEDSV